MDQDKINGIIRGACTVTFTEHPRSEAELNDETAKYLGYRTINGLRYFTECPYPG
ncbi:MAG: hypothetical protein WC764_04685 [Candidatus Paceibacterota bacterium]